LDNQNEDYILDDNESNQNNENMDMDDNNTLPTNEVSGKVANSNSLIIYAPLSSIEFHQNFTDDEYFMVKLCHICDKANVPHHIIDDIVDLMRECKINYMQIQPEKLLKQKNFLKHLEKRFISPVPQSIVVGLEGFSSNDILYSRSYRDSAEIIWYDFQKQAMDLINDVSIWGNLDNFRGTIDPILSPQNCPDKMG